MKSEQLLTPGKIFEDDILAGPECTNNPAEDVPEPYDHAQNLTGTLSIELGAKSLRLRVYDALMNDSTDSQPRSETTELRSAAPPLWAGAASFCPAGTRTSNTDTLPLESSPVPFVERLRRSDRFESGLRITGARALRLGGGCG